MSDSSAIRNALGGFPEKEKQGDSATLRNALQELQYKAQDQIYNLPYKSSSTPSAPTTPTQTPAPTQNTQTVSYNPPTTTPTLQSMTPSTGANTGNWFNDIVSNAANAINGVNSANMQNQQAGIQQVKGLGVTDPTASGILGTGLGALESLGQAAGGVASALGGGVNNLPVIGQPIQQAAGYIGGRYNEANATTAGLGATFTKLTDPSALAGRVTNNIVDQVQAGNGFDVNSYLKSALSPTLPTEKLQTLTPSEQTTQLAANTLTAIQKGDVGAAVKNALGMVYQYGDDQYNKLDTSQQIVASWAFDFLNFVPGMGIGEAQKATKLNELTTDVGRIADKADLLPKSGFFGRFGTPAAKVTEVVKSGMQNLLLRTSFAQNADELFNSARAFETAGRDANSFDEVVKTYAGLSSVPAQRASRLLQGFGDTIDGIEQGYRALENGVQAAGDTSKLPTTFKNFANDVKAGRAAESDLLEVTQAELAARAQEHMAQSAAKLYPLQNVSAPINLAKRFMNNLKGAEALLYIGLSPVTFAKNLLNGYVTMAIEGVNPLFNAEREIVRLRKLGQVEKAVDLERALKYQKLMTNTGGAVRKALGEGQFATAQTGAFGNFMSKITNTALGGGLRWYEHMESGMRAKVWTDTYYKAMAHNWDVGKWIPEMDAATQAVLHQYRVDPAEITNIIKEAGNDKAAIVRNVADYMDGKRGAAIDWDKVAEQMGVSKQELTSLMDEHDQAQATQMASDIASRVMSGEDKATVVNEVVGQAAQEYAAATAERIGAELPPEARMAQIEARMQEIDQAQVALRKGQKNIPKVNRAAYDDLENELQSLQYEQSDLQDKLGYSEEEKLFGKAPTTPEPTAPVEVVPSAPSESAPKLKPTDGWKLHLATDSPEEVSAALKELGLTHKVGNNSGQAGKDITVYIGSRTDAEKAAQQIESRFGSKLNAPHGETLADDLAFTDKVMGRFDIGSSDPTFHQYGSKGVPFTKDAVNNRTFGGQFDSDQARAEADRLLRQKYGDFYGGGELASQTSIPPVPESPLPPQDLPSIQLTQGQQNAQQYLLGVKRADGSPVYTAEQLATWRPDTLERIAGEMQSTQATLDSVLKTASQKGIASATEKGAPNNKNLLAVLNKHGGYTIYDAAGKATGYREGAFKTLEDVRLRAQEAQSIVDEYGASAAREADKIPKGQVFNEQGLLQEIQKQIDAQTEIEKLRNIAQEDENATRILSRDEMVKAKARTQADVLESLMNLWNSEDVRQVQLGTDAKNRVMGWIRREVLNGANDAHAAATVAADWMDNAVMISRDQETVFDAALGVLSPFQFWRSRFALESLRRVADKPARLSWYLKLRELQDQVHNDPRYPKRLVGKMFIPIWGVPQWAGGGMWFDPEEQATSIQQVFGLNQFSNDVTDQDVAANIRALAERGEISLADATQAIANGKGTLWEQTKLRLQELSSSNAGADDFASMFRPHLPLDILWKLKTGNASDIGVLFPITRLVRGATALLPKGNFLNQTGQGLNIEQPLKAGLRALTGNSDIPDWDKWELYRTDRALADMVGEGLVNERDAMLAMIERKGTYYDQAVARAQQQMGLQNYSVFGGNIFPKGEQQYYQSVIIRNKLIDQAVAQLGGNPASMSYGEKYDLIKANGLNKRGTPLGDFYTQHPEYNARGDSYAEPEQRMKGFLSDEMWTTYNNLSALDKRLARNADPALTSYITNPQRDFQSATIDQLGSWVKTLRGYVPQSSLAPLVPNPPQFTNATPNQSARYQNILDQQTRYFGDLSQLQPKLDAYSRLSATDKRAYRAVNADVDTYFRWYAAQMKANPDLDKLLHPDYVATKYPADTQAGTNSVIRQTQSLLSKQVYRIGDASTRRYHAPSGAKGATGAGKVSGKLSLSLLSPQAQKELQKKWADPKYFLSKASFGELFALYRKYRGKAQSFNQWLTLWQQGAL